MRCPACGSLDDKVVDSRQAEDGQSIRRRRQCLACSGRFTTFERVEMLALAVVKRSGHREPFDPAKITRGVLAAAKARPVSDSQVEALAAAVEEEVRLDGAPEVTSERVGRAVLERLYGLDAVAAVRFASVYKGFDAPSDFEDELTLLTKRTEPKDRLTP
ncbi:MAG: transcriptional regulator NrdR [Acidimicrobiales bacterium]